ncbi:hypothetical protein C666_01020 [Thauera linaloolentis 47Lol = DSM 12138]|uniref:C1q domain-containing protein n=1 Tax=Thauera linaloolentis (strain DSM 12138 / JCM 21573 / CCUG 41526 / CIP 105981 / IAM 15112 / NBRC 102519 / 47Lol) TaxID=1123367 RepID=N6Z7B8_THAL4|nr:hypothetical protein C666_01020 [Thauera linaloolentis 47Lol = DSM 12138]
MQDKAREQVSVMDFGAAGDGVSDDTAAIQAAIDFAAPKGLEIHVPAGAFLVSSPLVYETEGFSPGLRISGAGMQRTTIVANFIAPDMSPVLDISGAEKAPYLYQLGGLIRGITFTKKNEATNVAGIRLLGCWYLTIEDVRVFNLDGDGIYTELRDDLSNDWGEPNNPDGYSVIGLRLNNCLMESVRYGIVQGSGIGSSQWHIFQTRVAGARLGGIVVAGYNCKIEKCGFGLNSLQAPEGEGFNVKITRVVSAAPTGVTISDTEFDASKDNHIIIDRTSGLTLKNNRFITSDRFGISVPTPKVHILAQSINREMVSYGCMHRIDDNFGAVTLYSGSSSCENCEISGVRIENNGNPYVGVTGFPADRGNRVSLGSTLLRYGNRKPTVIAGFSSSALTAGVNIGGSSAALSFDSLLNNGGIYSVNSSYDPLTGVFTAPLDGCYIFDVFICITISADATVNLILSKNGSGAASSSGFSRSGFRTTFSLRAAIELKSGDAIRVLASQSHGGNVALHNDRNTHGFSVFLA